MSIQSERRRLRASLDRGLFLPVDSYREAAPWLRRPFAPEAVRFRVVEAWGANDEKPTNAIVAPYIDVRAVFARLNTVCPDLWSEGEPVVIGGHPWATIHMCAGMRAGVQVVLTRRDIGDGAPGKGKVSDSIKRAAVHFGVGESLYAFPPMQINATEQEQAEVLPSGEPGGLLRPWSQDGEKWLNLTRAGEDYARDIYRRWLLKTGIPTFGRPLDHGNLTAESETVVTGPPRPRASREQAPTPQRRTLPKRQNRGEQVVGAVEPEPVEMDPEAVALAQLDALLSATDGLAGERTACNAVMVAYGGTTAEFRLSQIVNAEKGRDGARAGLEKLLATLSSVKRIDPSDVGTSEP